MQAVTIESSVCLTVPYHFLEKDGERGRATRGDKQNTFSCFNILKTCLASPSLLYAFTKVVCRMISGFKLAFSMEDIINAAVLRSFISIHVEIGAMYKRESGSTW